MGEVKSSIKAPENELFEQFSWFNGEFAPKIQKACDEFFGDFFLTKLLSVSNNINVLFPGEDYFATKIRVDKQHDIFIRLSEEATKMVLDTVLGAKDRKAAHKAFDLADITDLEAKIISSFNDFTYNAIIHSLLPPVDKSQKRKNMDTINLTFFIKNKENNNGGKLILSIPKVLLAPKSIISQVEKFEPMDFKTSTLKVNIKVGTTKFPVKDLKNLEKEDIVVFEESNIQTMILRYEGIEKNIRITPNPGLIIPIDNNSGGKNMEEHSLSQTIWDSIQVEMGAEFEKVKISLGDLKNIEQGLVVDLSTIYDNKIYLKVENKTIAQGELVIINDHYGVRIDEVFASEKNKASEMQIPAEAPLETQSEAPIAAGSVEDEFDYSDFELEDQDI